MAKPNDNQLKNSQDGYLWNGVKIRHLNKGQLLEVLIILIHKYEAAVKY